MKGNGAHVLSLEGRTGATVYPRHRHHIAGDDVFSGVSEARAGRPARRWLVELRVKRLPVGADAGVSEAAGLRVCFGHIFCKHAERTAGLSFHCSAISAN
jgi:hypothetical protein